MKQFHVSEDGVVRECTAKSKESCPVKNPLGEPSEHFTDYLLAKRSSEELLNMKFGLVHVFQKGKRIKTPIPLSNEAYLNSSIAYRDEDEIRRQEALEREYFDQLPAMKLKNLDSPDTKALKVLNAPDLANLLMDMGRENGFEKEMSSAIVMSTILHARQKRFERGRFKNAPYIEHPLRNAVRISRWGVSDRDVLLAAVLHDAPEDGSIDYITLYENEHPEELTELEARGRLRKEIGRRFGEETLRVIDAVTNEYQDDEEKGEQTLEEKTAVYTKKMEDSIIDEKVYLVKIADFVDNATSLYHHDSPERRKKIFSMAYKYLPVVDVFIEKLTLLEGSVDTVNRNKIYDQLGRTKTRLQTIVDRGAAL